jgi:hypothetical protein
MEYSELVENVGNALTKLVRTDYGDLCRHLADSATGIDSRKYSQLELDAFGWTDSYNANAAMIVKAALATNQRKTTNFAAMAQNSFATDSVCRICDHDLIVACGRIIHRNRDIPCERESRWLSSTSLTNYDTEVSQ